jgi:hypothetical protein
MDPRALLALEALGQLENRVTLDKYEPNMV